MKFGPVFIIGCQRSGTTLMREILRRHSQIFVPTEETYFFYRLHGNRKLIERLTQELDEEKVSSILYHWAVVKRFQDPPQWGGVPLEVLTRKVTQYLRKNNDREKDVWKKILISIMKTASCNEGKTIWGEKTPEHAYVIPFLYRMFPQAYFIHLVRDGRNVTSSLYIRQNSSTINEMLYHASTWKDSIRRVKRFVVAHPEAKIINVKFEDLTKNPSSVINSVCGYIGVSFEEEMLDINYSNSSYKVERNRNAKGIRNISKDKWRSVIPHQWKSILNDFLADELMQFNYDTEINEPHERCLKWHRVKASLVWFKYLVEINLKIMIARTRYASLIRRLLRLNPDY